MSLYDLFVYIYNIMYKYTRYIRNQHYCIVFFYSFFLALEIGSNVFCARIYIYISIYIYINNIYIYIIEGSLEVKLPTIWRDEKQSRAEAERRGRLEERRSEEKE